MITIWMYRKPEWYKWTCDTLALKFLVLCKMLYTNNTLHKQYIFIHCTAWARVPPPLTAAPDDKSAPTVAPPGSRHARIFPKVWRLAAQNGSTTCLNSIKTHAATAYTANVPVFIFQCWSKSADVSIILTLFKQKVKKNSASVGVDFGYMFSNT